MMPDSTDRMILSLLQENARTSNAEIARTIGIAPSGVLERIRKLEQRGIIKGYHASIDPEALGQGLTAFVRMRTGFNDEHSTAVETLAAMPEVLEIHETAGDDCLMLKIRVADMKAYSDFLNSRIRKVPQIRDTSTTMVINTVKEAPEVIIPDPE